MRGVADAPAQPHHLRLWNDFLDARGMREPDGRPLYAYKMSDAEYQEVRQFLACSDPSDHPAAWILFASEWWKREYAGGAWAWQPLFQCIGHEAPYHVGIQAMVESGRRAWKLEATHTGGKRFLGVVATNGGLPLRLIESAQGKLAQLLKVVLSQAIRHNLAAGAIRAEIEALQTYLPRSYRQAMIFDLLMQVVDVVKSLNERYRLRDESNPISTLSAREPDWIDKFPLRVDGDAAQQLVRGLIRDAVAVERVAYGIPFALRRQLRFDTDGGCAFDVTTEVAPNANVEAIAALFGVESQELPHFFQVSLVAGDRQYPLADCVLRREEVRISDKNPCIDANSYFKPMQLRASRFGEPFSITSLPGSESLDVDAPWVFEDARPAAVLLRVGSARLRQPGSLLCAPDRAVVYSEDGEYAALPCPIDGRALYHLPSGSTRIAYLGDSYRVLCGTASAQNITVHWRGRLLPLDSTPSAVYLGNPTLHEVSEDGHVSSVTRGKLLWRSSSGQAIDVRATDSVEGMGVMHWINDGVTQARQEMVCLPPNAKIEYESGRSGLGGTLWLRNWPALGVNSEDSRCRVEAERLGCDWQVTIEAVSNERPATISLSIAWPGNKAQRVQVPFPSSGAVFLNAAGMRLADTDILDLRQLVGSRLRLLPGRFPQTWQLCLSVRTDSDEGEIAHRMLSYRASGDIRLFELVPTIREMLSCTESLDAIVQIEAIEGGSTRARLRVGRYVARLARDPDTGCVGSVTSLSKALTENGESMAVMALLLDEPERGPVELRRAPPDGQFADRWRFDPEARKPGPWLIFPDAGVEDAFRPVAWNIRDSIVASAPVSRLRQALRIFDADGRMDALSEAIEAMLRSPGDGDWEVLASIVEHAGHLPLSSLDIWRALARQPRGMVMALLHLDGFAERVFARVSEELPFEWLLTSPEDWETVVRTLRDFYDAESGDRGLRSLSLLLETRLQALGIGQPGVKLGLELAIYRVLGQSTSREIVMAANHPQTLLMVMRDSYLHGDRSSLQSMLQSMSSDSTIWPNQLADEVAKIASSEGGQALFSGITVPPGDPKFPTIAMPFLVGDDVCRGKAAEWFGSSKRLHALRAYRSFDPYWFDQAYLLGVLNALAAAERH